MGKLSVLASDTTCASLGSPSSYTFITTFSYHLKLHSLKTLEDLLVDICRTRRRGSIRPCDGMQFYVTD